MISAAVRQLWVPPSTHDTNTATALGADQFSRERMSASPCTVPTSGLLPSRPTRLVPLGTFFLGSFPLLFRDNFPIWDLYSFPFGFRAGMMLFPLGRRIQDRHCLIPNVNAPVCLVQQDVTDSLAAPSPGRFPHCRGRRDSFIVQGRRDATMATPGDVHIKDAIYDLCFLVVYNPFYTQNGSTAVSPLLARDRHGYIVVAV
jgi:hypothetical protein